MSRSCHSATFSSAAMALPRISRARPTICSQPIGLRLWGIADDPFCPLPKRLFDLADLSLLQPANLQCKLLERGGGDRERCQAARRDDRAESPATKSAAGSRSSRLHTSASIAGSRCANVPTAPEILPTLTTSRARCTRAMLRAISGIPERQLQAKRHRLGMHAVRAADHWRADGVPERAS